MKRNRSKSGGSGERRRKNGSSERDRSKSESEEEEEEELPFESVSRKGYVPPSKRARKVHTPLRPKGDEEEDGGGGAAEGGGGKKKGKGSSPGDAMGVVKRPVKDEDEVDKTKGASFEVEGAPPTPPTPRPPTPVPKVPAVEEERPEVEKSDPGERREESQEAEVMRVFFVFPSQHEKSPHKSSNSVQARPGAKQDPLQEELEREGKAAEPSDGGKGLLRNQTKDSKPGVKVEKEPSPTKPAAPKSAGPPPPGEAKIAAAAPDVVKIDQEPPEPAPPPAKPPPPKEQAEGVPSPKEPISPKVGPPSLGRMSLFEEVVDAGGREEQGAVEVGREGEEGTTCTDDDYD